jgi:flagellar motor switch protein FliM
MAEILSQEEIDALLNALETSDIDDKLGAGQSKGIQRVKDYDFKRPDKFSKDQIRILHMILESFARNWATFLSGKLRSLVYIEVSSIDQLPYEEFIRSTFTPSVISVFVMEPLEGSAIIDISIPVAFAIIERLVGGTGVAGSDVRELTEIEEALIEVIVSDALRSLRSAMNEIVQVNPRLDAIEYNPQFTQIVPPSEMVLFASLEVRTGENRGMIGICLPFLMLEPILNELSSQRFFKRGKEETVDLQRMTQKLRLLEPTMLYLSVEVGKVELTVQQVLDLAPGDVISLPVKINDLFQVYIGEDPTPIYQARPGVIGRYKGVELIDFCEE